MQKEIPQVYVADFTVRYAPKKEMAKIKSDKPSVREKAIKTHVKEFPTKATKDRILKSIWRSKKIKGDFKNFMVYAKNIKVKGNMGKVSYKFDYNKD